MATAAVLPAQHGSPPGAGTTVSGSLEVKTVEIELAVGYLASILNCFFKGMTP
jgi:hypothetical protein